MKRRMFTGYFGNITNYSKNKELKFVSIARFNSFWKGFESKKLAPPADIIKIKDEALYTRLYYERVLNKLNPQELLTRTICSLACACLRVFLLLPCIKTSTHHDLKTTKFLSKLWKFENSYTAFNILCYTMFIKFQVSWFDSIGNG